MAKNNYWSERIAKSQIAITDKSIADIEKQLVKYYSSTMRQIIADFESVYIKILENKTEGQEITPADLYKLDKYWKMQAQAADELKKLGEKEEALFSKEFETNWYNIYNSIGINKSEETFSTIDKKAVQQMINTIWVADGKSWSERIWDNNAQLLETLNEGLLHVLTSGKTTKYLKRELQERFNVSFGRADALVRTELAHIQTQAAQKRYEDGGVKMVQVWADEDERRCDECGKLHQKLFPIGGKMPVPVHPRCRCCIIPVIDTGLFSSKNKA